MTRRFFRILKSHSAAPKGKSRPSGSPLARRSSRPPPRRPLKMSLLGRNMSKYFPYKEISQKCQRKTIWEKPMREDFFTPPPRGAGEEHRRKCGGGKNGQEGGMGWRGERGRGLRNADPFPRWPLWAAPLPTARPDGHGVPRPHPALHSGPLRSANRRIVT